MFISFLGSVSWYNSECQSKPAIAHAVETRYNYQPDLFLGPPCSAGTYMAHTFVCDCKVFYVTVHNKYLTMFSDKEGNFTGRLKRAQKCSMNHSNIPFRGVGANIRSIPTAKL